MMDTPTEETQVSVESELKAAQKIKDPLTRAIRLAELLKTATVLRSEVSAARDKAIAAALRTSTQTEVGEQLGVSKVRIGQIEARVNGSDRYQTSGSRIGKKKK